MTLLLVTAVQAEADALQSGLPPDPEGRRPGGVVVAATGVGPAAAAAGTARLLALAEAAGTPYSAVVSAGVAGGFPDRAAPGTTVLAANSVAADLGAESPGGFLTLDELGFGDSAAPADRTLLAALRAVLPAALVGDVLTVSTVTGTAGSAAALAARHPAALAEAMEGYGAACAAAGAGVPFAELRTISNPIGPRDRAAWRVGDALAALTAAAPALDAVAAAWPGR
jgi:futalosine hydrolase